MDISRRHALVFFSLVFWVFAAGCSASTEPAAPAEPTPAVEPTPTAIATPTVSPTDPEEPTAIAGVPSEPGVERVYRGVLQEQHCVIDTAAPDILNVHQGPSADDPVVATLAPGQCRIFLTEGLDDDWFEIIADLDNDELRGWVRPEAIAPVRAVIDPDAPMVVVTIAVEYELDFPSSEAPIEAFRLADADGLVVGFLDTNGQITVPTDLDLRRARVEAEWADDPFCAWTGELDFEGSDDRYSSLLEAICA